MAYIFFDPKYKMMSFALAHIFPSVIGINCPLTCHLFYHILSATSRAPLRTVNVTRVELIILSQLAFESLDSLCIFLKVPNKEMFNKFVATAHMRYVITATKLIYSSLRI